MKNRISLLAAGSALVLSACGGGGGGGGDAGPAPAPVSTMSTVTAANSTKVAGNAYASSSEISESSSSMSSFLTGVSVGRADISLVSPVLDLIRRVRPQDGTPLLTGITLTESCSGGGMLTIEANLSNQQTASVGDTIAITANNCSEDGDTINGKFSAKFAAVSGDVLNAVTWSATLDTVFTNFSISTGSETVSANGDMKIAINQTNLSSNTVTVSGKSLQTTEQRSGITLATRTLGDYSMTGSSRNGLITSAATFNMTGKTNELGQFSYSVKNLQPFVSMGTSMPTSGSLIVNGAASSVTVTALSSSSVRLDFSAKGDGTITQSNTLSWTELLTAF